MGTVHKLAAAAQNITPREAVCACVATISQAESASAHPDGQPRRYSRGTIDRWIRAHRGGGLEALKPSPRADTGTVRAHPELFSEAAALRPEVPVRGADRLDPVPPARRHRGRADHPRAAAPRRAAPRGPDSRAENLRAV
jgi:hypothetical protein